MPRRRTPRIRTLRTAMPRRRTRQRGVTFIVTLAVLSALVVLVAGFAATQRAATRERIGRLEAVRARLAAEAGIQRAIAELNTLSTDRTVPTAVTDAWATLGGTVDAPGSEEFDLASGSFRLQILDASGRVDLNVATEEELTSLGLTQEQTDSLLDWREAPTAAPRPLGAKDAYYNALPEPYNVHGTRLRTVDELLLVKGVTPDLLYRAGALQENSTATQASVPGADSVSLNDLLTTVSASPNEAPTGDARFNLNGQGVTETTLQQRLNVPLPVATAIIAAKTGRANGRFTLLSQALAVAPTAAAALVDGATVVQSEQLEGRVNFNTAPAEVLATLPGVTPDIAQSIVSRAGGTPFTRLSEILALNNSPQFAATVADNAAVRSSAFIVRSVGKVGGTTVALIATVQIGNGTVGGTAADEAPRILRIEEPPFSDMPARWNWIDVATTTTLQEASRP